MSLQNPSSPKISNDLDKQALHGVMTDLSHIDLATNSATFFVRWSIIKGQKYQKFEYFSHNINILGYAADDFLTGKIKWQDIVHPEDKAWVLKEIETAIFSGATEYVITYRIKAKDKYRWIQDSTTLVRAPNSTLQYGQSIVIDVSENKEVEEQLKVKNVYLNLLHETAINLGEKQDLKQTLNTIISQLRQFNTDTDTYIALKNSDNSALTMKAGTGVFEPLIGNSIGDKSFGAMGEVWQSLKAVYIEDYKNYADRVHEDYTNDIVSVACLPLISNGLFLGVIGYNSSRYIEFTEDVKTLHQRFAQLVSFALTNAQIVDDLNSQLGTQKLLEEQLRTEQHSLAHQVKFRTNLSELIENSLASNFRVGDTSFYEMILKSATQSISGAEASSLLVRQSDDTFHFVGTINYPLDELEDITLQEKELHIQADCKNPILQYHVDNSQLDNNKQESLNKKLNELQVTLSIPIHTDNQLIALINVDNFSNKEVFTSETVQLAQVFSRHIAALWKRFKLEDTLQQREKQYKELFDDAQQKSDELRLLYELQHALSSQLELTELFNISLQKITEIFGYSFSYIRTLEDEHLRLVANYGFQTSLLPDLVSTKHPIAKTLIEQKQLFYLNPDSYEKHLSNKTEMFGTSTMLLPILVNSQFWGFMGIGHKDKELYKSDFSLGQKVVELMSVAIENAQLHTHVKNDLRRNESLHKISQAVQEYDNLNELMDSIIEHIRQAMNARWAIIYKIDLNRQCIESVSTTNIKKSPLKILTFEELITSLAGWVIENKESVYTPKGEIDKRESTEISEFLKEIQIGCDAVVPFIHNGKVEGVISVFNDMDDSNFSDNDLQLLDTVANQVGAAIAKHKLMRQIEHQAFHDSLTNLPNRLQFENDISSIIIQARRRKIQFAVLFIDLDGFKHINDTLGHAVGDQLLVAVAERMQGRKRKEDILARMGGDEFALVLSGVNNREDALNIANNYLSFFIEPYSISEQDITVGASIGVSLYPEDGKDIHTLLSNADSAMYQAKNSGKNSVSGFTPSLAEEVKERAKIERELKLAVERDELELHYQPQYNITTQEVIGLEALVRWRHPEKGLISPGIFIPIAEESNLIIDIGNWVLYKACRQNAEWQAKGHPTFCMAVNISAKQFVKDDFVETVINALKHSGLQSEYLELEVTETVVMNDVQIVIERLKLLQKLNINIAIDDFGTGYSSLTYLQDLPLDKLKIDKSFVDKLETSANPAIIITILTLAQSLGLSTIAEGVETEKQLNLLRDLGCDEAQGFHFSKPLPPEKVLKILENIQN